VKIELVQGQSAESLLADERFQSQWSALWSQCPWATAFQRCGFHRAWYATYRNEYSPLLAISRDSCGNLQGLLALARAPDGRHIVAGGLHAEYHAWISTPALGDDFPAAAFATLHRESHPGPIVFKFLAAGAPIQWLSRPEMKRLSVARSYTRPILELGDERAVQKSLNKSHTKQKFRRLGQLGEISFSRIACPEEFESLFDQMAVLYDLRHGAVQGTAPFCSAPRQKEFHLAMMTTPGLLHVTVLRVGQRLAAAHFGTCGNGELHMGTLVYDPSLSRHSPGRLLILKLAQMLQADGYRRVDLTPGGDAYKDLLASSVDVVHTLTILPHASQAFVVAAREGIRDTCHRACKALGTTPMQARVRLRNLPAPSQIVPALARRAGQWVFSHRPSSVYFCRPREAKPTTACDQIQRDNWEDLLSYRPQRNGPTRQQFLSMSLQWIEQGQHVYTATESGRLQHMAWVIEQPDQRQVDQWLADFPIPYQSVFVHDFRAIAQTTNWNLAEMLLMRIVQDAAGACADTGIMLAIAGTRHDQRGLAQRNGFTCIGSLRHNVILGRHRRRIESFDPAAFDKHSAVRPAAQPALGGTTELPPPALTAFEPRQLQTSGQRHD